MLETRIYELGVPNVCVEEYFVNTILENVLETYDGDVWDTGLLSEIVSFSFDPNVAIQKGDDAFNRVNIIEKPSISTNGLEIQLWWAYQSIYWVPLSLIRESNTIEVAKHVVANKCNNKRDIHWWVSKVLKKRSRILAKVEARCRKPHK